VVIIQFDTPAEGTNTLNIGRRTDADLFLNKQVDGTANLHFSAVAIPDINASESVIIGSIALQGFVVSANITFSSNVWRGPEGAKTIRYQQADNRRLPVATPWSDPPRQESTPRLDWRQAAVLPDEVLLTWVDPDRQEKSLVLRWESTGVHSESSTRIEYQYPDRQETSVFVVWDGECVGHESSILSQYLHPERKQASYVLPWELTNPIEYTRHLPYSHPVRRKKKYRIPWDDAVSVVALWPRLDLFTPPPPLPRVITPDLVFTCPVSVDKTGLHFGVICGQVSRYRTIPTLRTYIMIQNISVIRVSDSLAIPAASITLEMNADSWAWGFNATLLGASALDAVQPVGGVPVELEVTINGYSWRVFVEEWTESKTFGKNSIGVKGRGVTSLLAAPYHIPQSGVQDSLLTVQQVLDAHLPIGEGWTIDWQANISPWNVAAGAWTWNQRTPIQAIFDAVQSVGLVVIPDRTTRTLKIQERYPVLPWQYVGTTPNLTIPDSAILSLQRQQPIATQANAVYVHGGDTGGVMARVYLDGTAGDRNAPTQSSALLTDQAGCRLLGERILAGQYEQPTIRSVTLPLGGVFALGEIGGLLQVNLGGIAHLGIINAVRVSADNDVRVRQTLSVGENTPNKWASFKRILPTDPLLLATIDTVHIDGTVTVTLTSGGVLRVRGSGVVGDSVYIQGGQVVGDAPDLSAVDIPV